MNSEPTYNDYQGCRFIIGKCDECFAPKCIYDCRDKREFVARIRDKLILELAEKGTTTAIIASTFNIKPFSVRRAIERRRNE